MKKLKEKKKPRIPYEELEAQRRLAEKTLPTIAIIIGCLSIVVAIISLFK